MNIIERSPFSPRILCRLNGKGRLVIRSVEHPKLDIYAGVNWLDLLYGVFHQMPDRVFLQRLQVGQKKKVIHISHCQGICLTKYVAFSMT